MKKNNQSPEGFDSNYTQNHLKRFQKTLQLIKKNAPAPQKILDLGSENPMGNMLVKEGYEVINTPKGIDLDYNEDLDLIRSSEFDVVTSFEIFEHLVNPYGILKNIGAKKLISTVPLKLWFADAYWNENDLFDRHYHEFESRQFDMLLKKTGWKILYSKKWTSPVFKFGFRPLLRNFTPRLYYVFAERD